MAAQTVGAAGHFASEAVASLGSKPGAADAIELRELQMQDIRDALRLGARDFARFRGDVVFLVLLYPVIGLLLVGFGLHLDLIPLIFPLMAGFALVGPLAAVGLYELSRRQEADLPASWADAFAVAARPGFAAVLLLGVVLFGVFAVWMMAAAMIYDATMGPAPPASLTAFLGDVLTTGAGWAMIVLGMAVGFVFAAVVLTISVVSFPLLVHREVGVPAAIAVSLRVTRQNPRVIAAWGLVVATGLVLGSIPALIGLMIVLPILGHATWYLYRRAVV